MNKKFIATLFILALSWCGFSQKLSMKVGANPTLINFSAALEVESNTKGFLLPRMTNAQIKAIASPATGLMIWCTNCGKTGELQMFNGTLWANYVASTTESIVTATVPTSTGGKLIFMAYNLGADTSADPLVPSWKLNGAYIQWGKRGPTGNWANAVSNGASGFGAAPLSGTDNLTAAIPGWSTVTASFGSWNVTESTPIKTANDPCPAGFRVPTRNEWVSIYSTTPINTQTNWSNVGGTPWIDSATNYSTGKLVSGSLYLPSTGVRNFSDGSILTRGNTGNYWSSTENGAIAFHLGFNEGTLIYPAYSSNRTYGMSIRCVSE